MAINLTKDSIQLREKHPGVPTQRPPQGQLAAPASQPPVVLAATFLRRGGPPLLRLSPPLSPQARRLPSGAGPDPQPTPPAAHPSETQPQEPRRRPGGVRPPPAATHRAPETGRALRGTTTHPPTAAGPGGRRSPTYTPRPSYQTPQRRERPTSGPHPSAPLPAAGRLPAARSPLAEPGCRSLGITGRACAPPTRGMRTPRSRCRRSASANPGAASAALPNPRSNHHHHDPPPAGRPTNRGRPPARRGPMAARPAGARANRGAAPCQAAPRLRRHDAILRLVRVGG